MSQFVPRGVYNITPTPFMPDSTLDLESLRRLIAFLKGQGVQGVTILGELGEVHKLSEAERDLVIETVMAEADGQLPVCVGTSHVATAQCVAFSQRAQALGASAIMLTPPKLARSNPAAIKAHYEEVAAAVALPIIVQDHPASSGVFMTPELVAEIMRDIPACQAVKLEDEPTPRKVSLILAQQPDIAIFGGLGGMMFLEELAHGAVGTMTGFAFPEILVAIYDRYSNGDIDAATDIFYRYCPLIRFENQALINLGLRKHIYHQRGLISHPDMRKPFTPVDAGTLADLQNLLARLRPG